MTTLDQAQPGMAPAVATARPLNRQDYKTLGLSALGGTLEFYDFVVFVFMMVKQINRLRREAPAAPAPAPVTPEDIVLLREIRDSLKR